MRISDWSSDVCSSDLVPFSVPCKGALGLLDQPSCGLVTYLPRLSLFHPRIRLTYIGGCNTGHWREVAGVNLSRRMLDLSSSADAAGADRLLLQHEQRSIGRGGTVRRVDGPPAFKAVELYGRHMTSDEGRGGKEG